MDGKKKPLKCSISIIREIKTCMSHALRVPCSGSEAPELEVKFILRCPGAIRDSDRQKDQLVGP
jgi:hypothetical protein